VGRPDRPLDPTAGALPRFANDLRQLRRHGGDRPTYRELADRAHYSASTLAEAAGGVRLPTLEVTLAYVAACGGDIDQWRDRWAALADTEAASLDRTAEPAAGGRAARAERAEARARTGATGPPPPAHAARASLPRRYWRYPAAAVALLAVAAANFALGQRTGYDAAHAESLRHPAVPATAVPQPAGGTSTLAGGAAAAPARGDTAGPAGGAPGTGRQLRYGFEVAVAPWAAAWNAANLHADIYPGAADTGRRSLRLRALPDRAAPPAIGTADVAGLQPGATVTFRIYYAGQGNGGIRPYAEDAGGGIHWTATPPLTLRHRGWTTYSWQVPDVAVRHIGLELDSLGTDALVIGLDSVVW
jgi:hypothetical protein